MLRNTMGGDVTFPEKTLRFNVISITRGWMGVTFSGEKLNIK